MVTKKRSVVVMFAVLLVSSGGEQLSRFQRWVAPDTGGWSEEVIALETRRLTRTMTRQPWCVAWVTALRLEACQSALIERREAGALSLDAVGNGGAF
jgi:hypothetical protein